MLSSETVQSPEILGSSKYTLLCMLRDKDVVFHEQQVGFGVRVVYYVSSCFKKKKKKHSSALSFLRPGICIWLEGWIFESSRSVILWSTFVVSG